MRLKEILKESKPSISLEVFPPKSYDAFARLLRVLPRLIALHPRFMSVTYGAMGTTQERTLEIAEMINTQYGVETACHLTCVGASRAELDEILSAIYDSNIHNIVALRGDPPHGEDKFVPPADGLSNANELVDHIYDFVSRENCEPFGIAVAGYPEKHIEAPDMKTDLINLKRKVYAGADCIITQLFYDNADFFQFVDEARSIGITIPIVPGLLPILSVRQIQRITSMCGAKIPPVLQSRLDKAIDDNELAQEIGINHCVEQARELIQHGVPGIHFYVLNRADHMEKIMDGIKDLV